MQQALKRMESIQAKIEELQKEQEKIEQEAAQALLEVIKRNGGLQVDFESLVGGIIEVIETIKTNGVKEGWQQAGRKFCAPKKSKPVG